MKKKNSKRTASSGLNTLMTTQMLAAIKGYKITKEQIEVVEPIYQKVSEILNLDVQTQKRGMVVLYKILSMNIRALKDTFIQDQLERLQQTPETQQQDMNSSSSSSSTNSSTTNHNINITLGRSGESNKIYHRKYRKNYRPTSMSTSSMIDLSSLQKTMYVDGSTSNDLDNNAGNVQISLTASQSNRKSNKSNINSQDEVTFNSDDPNLRLLKYESLMWSACALFISHTQDEENGLEWNRINVSQLLSGCRLRIMAFFDNMALIQNHEKKKILNLSPNFNETMQQLKSVVLTNTLLYRKFTSLWLVRDTIASENVVSKRGKKAVETQLIYFSWTLFLLIKTRINGVEPNLVDNYRLLIACVILTIEGHSAHQAKALAERREKQSGTMAPSPELRNEKAQVKRKEAEVVAALLMSGGLGQISPETSGKVSPPALTAAMKMKIAGCNNSGDILKLFVEQIGTVEFEDILTSVKQVESFVADLLSNKLISSTPSPDAISGSIVSKNFQGLLGKELAINTYNMKEEYGKNLVSMWNLDELVLLKADAFDFIGTPIKLSSNRRPRFNSTNSTKHLFQNRSSFDITKLNGNNSNTKAPNGSGGDGSGGGGGGNMDGRNKKQITTAVKTGMLVHQVRGVRSPQRSPGFKDYVAATPITEAFQYNSWLQQKIKKSKIGPTSMTQKCFDQCEKSPLKFMEDLLNQSISNISTIITQPRRSGIFNLNDDSNNSINSIAQPPRSRLNSSKKDGSPFTIGSRTGAFARLENTVKKRLSPEHHTTNDNSSHNNNGTATNISSTSVGNSSPPMNGNNSPRLRLRFNAALESSVKLYWRVLNALLINLSKKPNSVDSINKLLWKEDFHKCLFALSVEVILIAKSITKAIFPKVIKLLNIHPAELIKTIEHFVRGEQSLPAQLRRHLRWCEEQILMKYAWETNSLMLKKIMEHRQQLIVIEQQPQAQPNNAARRRKELSYTVDKFLEKVVEIAAKRVRDLCEKLHLPGQIVDQAWTVVRHAILVKFELIQDRHIYHIIIAGIYGICKVNQIKMTFQLIIEKYHELEELYSPAVITSGDKKAVRDKIIHKIKINTNDEVDPQTGANVSYVQGNIIEYYNKLFVQSMKTFLLKFKKNETTGKILAVPEQTSRTINKPEMWGTQIFVSSTRKSHVGSKSDRRAVSSTENVYNNSNTSIVNNTNGGGGGGGDDAYKGLPGVDQTPRTAALYAKKENATLNRINEFVNRRTPLHFDDDGDITMVPINQTHDNNNNNNEKKRKTMSGGKEGEEANNNNNDNNTARKRIKLTTEVLL